MDISFSTGDYYVTLAEYDTTTAECTVVDNFYYSVSQDDVSLIVYGIDNSGDTAPGVIAYYTDSYGDEYSDCIELDLD